MRPLTKRQYLGEGYIHIFRNRLTQEEVVRPCTEEEYQSMLGKDGHNFNPASERGLEWVCSAGGTIKVDTPSSLLGEDEYCEIGEEAVVWLSSRKIEEKQLRVPLSEIKSDIIDETKYAKPTR